MLDDIGARRTPKQVWRVLLDSGSDGDIVFRHKGHHETWIPFKERYSHVRWHMSGGNYTTSKLAEMDLVFPEFSARKEFHLEPDICDVPADDEPPQYDLIIGIETLQKWGIILDFKSKELTLDEVKLPMNRSALDLGSQKQLNATFARHLEPSSTRDMTSRAVEILDAKYEKADLPQIVADNCDHLTINERQQFTKYEELFDGTLGEWQAEPVSLQLNKDAKPYHGRPYPVPHVHLKTLKKEVERLCKIGVLKKQPRSEWASPTFIIPKKNGTVRFISDFREVNKRIIRTPYPIPKITSILQELEGFTYATSLDLNMGYYTISLDADAQKICTIILPWGKYSYQRLPMGISRSPDIFQEKMSGLMETLEYVRVYIDDLLTMTKGSFDDHLDKLEQVLIRLQAKGLRVNANKSHFCKDEVEYLGYILTREGVRPQPEKVSALLAISPPRSVKELRRFLGMVQYYRDLWEKRSHLLAPLTDLVGECGHTKETRKNNTPKKKWYWNDTHQAAFDGTKRMLAREVMLAYPDFSSEFEVFTDASSRQLGAVITQRGRPLAFFSRKLSEAQRKYSVTELELLSIVECLKEFKSMLWGQRIKVYTDHKNLVRDALGFTSDRVYRWRLLLEEFSPEIVYIKGVDNTVADAISRLEYDPSKNVTDVRDCDKQCFAMAKLLSHIDTQDNPLEDLASVCSKSCFASTFVNTGDKKEEERIYPLTVAEIAEYQRSDKKLKPLFTDKDPHGHISAKIVDDIEVLVYDNTRLVIPKPLQARTVQWYHHYLQHPGHTRLEETLSAVMYWKSMRTTVREHVKHCDRCQRGKKRKRQFGKLPSKNAETIPWKSVCVDLIGPYTLKGKDGTVLDFMCLTMIDPATGWFEIIELPCTTVEKKDKQGKKVIEVVFDKSSAQISRLFNKQWLSRYPRPNYITYDNGSEFKLHFEAFCDSYSLKRKPTTVKNPQANAILERMHGVITNMMRTRGLDQSQSLSEQDIDDFLVDVAWAIRSTYHTVLQSSPGAAIFGRDMLFDIPYLADWNDIGRRRQALVDRNNERENKRRVDFDYQIGSRVMIRKDGVLRKAEDKYEGPYTVTRIHTNGTVRIQRGTVSERLNIRRLTPYYAPHT